MIELENVGKAYPRQGGGTVQALAEVSLRLRLQGVASRGVSESLAEGGTQPAR